MVRAIGCAALIVMFGWVGVARGEPKTWDYQANGQWQAVAQPTSGPASDPVLDRAERLLQLGQSKQARTVALKWILDHKEDPRGDRALFIMAEAEDKGGDPILGFYYLDQLLEEHPESRLYSTAMQKQFEIADAYLRGRKRKFLGLPILSAEDEAVEMLFRVQQRAPKSPIAEKALLRTANFYFADRQYDLSEDAFGMFVRQYPRSPSVPGAKLKQAYSAYALFHGPRFEVTPIIDARERLSVIMAEYPQLAAQENIPALLDTIDAAMARKLYLRADFYRRTHEPQAAAYTYRYLISAYPDSGDAAKAKTQLAKLPQWSKALPEPKVQQDAAVLRSVPVPMPKIR
jgi:outer membrane protein assembly factor BamD (BamD/ComL family)